MNANRSLRLILGVAVGVLFVWLILQHVKISQLAQTIRGARIPWVVAALVLFCLGFVCRIARWREMLLKDSPKLRWGDCVGPLLAGFATNNVLPLRAGDILRAFAFNKQLRTTSGIVLASLFVERLLDLLMLMVALGSAMVSFRLDANSLAGIGGVAICMISLATLSVLFFPAVFSRLARWGGEVAARLVPRFGGRLAREIEKAITTLDHLSGGRTMLRLVAWSIFVWLAEGGVFCLVAAALPGLSVVRGGWLALPAGTLATLIPSTPGYLGTFDYFTIRAMIAVGNSPSVSTAYALLVHALLWLPPTLMGGSYLAIRHIRRSDKDIGIRDYQS